MAVRYEVDASSAIDQPHGFEVLYEQRYFKDGRLHSPYAIHLDEIE
jgi:hypothetical protein